jgi:hypothetical protein
VEHLSSTISMTGNIAMGYVKMRAIEMPNLTTNDVALSGSTIVMIDGT